MCNLADCIKVACDFVSPENVERCSTLTREFRAQNQTKAWKEDVLQLRTMMWFAWLSCGAQERRLRETAEAGARPSANGNTDTSTSTSTTSAPDAPSFAEPTEASDVARSAGGSQPPRPAAQASESPSTSTSTASA